MVIREPSFWKVKSKKMKWSHHQQTANELDFNDEPTEPSMPAVVLPPSSPPLDWYTPPAGEANFPSTHPPQSSFPNEQIGQATRRSTWLTPVYPVLPVSAFTSNPNQQTVEGPAQPYPVRPPTAISSRNNQRKHSVLPAFVGMFFVAVQILLLVRFALRLIAPTASSGTPWIGIIYTVSGVCVLPFRLLFQHLAIPIPESLEIYTLVAILFYGLLSRVLARFTRALLRSL
jgi:hypothetical protein